MSLGEWLIDKGIPLLVNSLLIPGGIWLVGAIRKAVTSIETATSKTSELEKKNAELEKRVNHVELNLRDLSGYLGGSREKPFKGFRKPDEEDT